MELGEQLGGESGRYCIGGMLGERGEEDLAVDQLAGVCYDEVGLEELEEDWGRVHFGTLAVENGCYAVGYPLFDVAVGVLGKEGEEGVESDLLLSRCHFEITLEDCFFEEERQELLSVEQTLLLEELQETFNCSWGFEESGHDRLE